MKVPAALERVDEKKFQTSTPLMKNKDCGASPVSILATRPKIMVKTKVWISGGMTNHSGPSTVCL